MLTTLKVAALRSSSPPGPRTLLAFAGPLLLVAAAGVGGLLVTLVNGVADCESPA
ncbi:MAG: hypothetical protein FJ096_10035 [Deltaproteobacteria bacterium]|nr:hypothetical protein [Deltaproteobacteria bacterium]